MKEDKMIKALEEFSLHEYVSVSRAYGRANVDKDVRYRAANLYGQIQIFRRDEPLISKELDLTLELAERVLFSEHFLLNNPVPRYPAYTNVRVLDWGLGTNQKSLFTKFWPRCWQTIHSLLSDLLSFEICSLAGVEHWQQDNSDLKVISSRVQRLQALMQHIPNQRPLHSLHINLNSPPDDWFSYALDESKTVALLHLTALPQTKEHDEFLFLRTIHISECCFWGVLTSVMAGMESANQGQMDLAIECLTRAIPFAEFLVPLFQAFKTMPSEHFAQFRDATGDASAVQSRTYQLMQIITMGLDERKAGIVAGIPEVADLVLHGHSDFVNLRAFLEMVAQQNIPEGEILISKAALLDKALYAWRCLHLGLARHYLPMNTIGTGGTRGALYLEMHYRHKIFPVAQQLSLNLAAASPFSLGASPKTIMERL